MAASTVARATNRGWKITPTEWTSEPSDSAAAEWSRYMSSPWSRGLRVDVGGHEGHRVSSTSRLCQENEGGNRTGESRGRYPDGPQPLHPERDRATSKNRGRGQRNQNQSAGDREHQEQWNELHHAGHSDRCRGQPQEHEVQQRPGQHHRTRLDPDERAG